MIQHYNAFISYKHAPLDNRVAAEIQTRLERFRIPKAIRKSSGIQKISRIFRDKEELLITSDLNDTIEHALMHSDYLIVICSYATKESIWVQKEIEFFLKTHTKDKILTVVAEGEPVDVVPRILREREITATLDDGTVETVTVPIEPLSCDYRGDFRKARKEELPRLAAAILGCSYDELKQRQRQYRVRRMAAAFSAAVALLTALSVYYAWSATQIKQNYILSLQNQSQYLSVESVSLLENGDRMSAMLLALEALPKNSEDERPVLPEAEYALSQAVNAYISPNENWYAVEYAFPHGGKINKILPSKDESRLAVLHSGYNFTIWDVERREKILEQVADSYIADSALSFDDHLLFHAGDYLYCYDIHNGTPLWQLDTRHYKGGNSNGNFTICVSETAPVAAVIAGDYLLTLDTATGKILQEIPRPTYEDENNWIGQSIQKCGIQFGKFSPDNKTLFLHLSADEDWLALCDLETGRFTVADFWFYGVDDAFFTEEGNVILMGKYRIRNGNYRIDSIYYYEDDYTEICCISPEGGFLWADEIHYTEMDVGLDSECIPFLYPGAQADIPAVAAIAGEKLVFYDIATGERLEENAYTAAIVTLTKFDDYFSAILTDGMLGQYMISSQRNMAADFCIAGIDLACDNDRLFVSDAETGNVLLYTYGLHDSNWTEMPLTEETEASFLGFHKHTAGSITLLTASDNLDNPFIVIDATTRTARIYAPFTEEFWKSKYVKGLTPDGSAIVIRDFNSESDAVVSAVDLRTGEYIPNYRTLPAGWSDLVLENDTAYFVGMIQDSQGDMRQGIIRQSSDGVYASLIVPTVQPEAYLLTNFLQITHKEHDAVLLRDYATDGPAYYYSVDLISRQVHHTDPIAYPGSTAIWAADGQLFFVTSENCIIAYDRSCREVYRITCNGMTADSLFASGEDLFVLYGCNTIYRYRASDGAFLNKIEMNNGSIAVLDDCRWDDSQPGTLALFNNDTLNLIDTQRWVVRTQVENCLSFDLQNGLIFTSQNRFGEPIRLGYYEIYSYGQLIEMAHRQLDGMTLSPEMRIKYGLE